MSTEDELKRWFNERDQPFQKSLEVAIRIWKSSNFVLTTKYECILQWFVDNREQLGRKTSDVPAGLLNEFLQLRCPPGLISLDRKRSFVDAIVLWANTWETSEDRQPVDVLCTLSELEMIQDLFRGEYRVYASVLRQIFKSYEVYLRSLKNMLIEQETQYFEKIMDSLISHAKKVGCVEEFEQMFTEHALAPLVEVILVFQSKGVKFFNELLELEKILMTDYVTCELIPRLLGLPVHVNLVAFECAVINYRGDVKFFQLLIKVIFNDLLEEKVKDPELILTIAAYTMEMLRKHDILLNFDVTKNSNAVQYLGGKVDSLVAQFRRDHLKAVLHLLCATLRLNPLILDKNIFVITTKIMLMRKNDEEQRASEEFLILLIEMFRKLSKAEKFVGNLQKSLVKCLEDHDMPKKTKKRRTATESPDEVDGKRVKLDDSLVSRPSGEDSTKNTSDYLSILFKDFVQHAGATRQEPTTNSFPHIDFAWPSVSIGVAFSKFVSGLVSKPALVIWKTLVYALSEQIKGFSSLNENFLFLLDINCALLCQFFAGSRLAEQSEKFWDKIEENRLITRQMLKQFGLLLLDQEHSNRTMNAFLETSYHLGLFELLMWYYRPDSMSDENQFKIASAHLHDYLSEGEWILIQQRIINFGKSECKYNANRLLLQRLKAKMLFHHKKSVQLQKYTLAPVAGDPLQMKLLLTDQATGSWLLKTMSITEKEEICEVLAHDLDLETIRHISEDKETLEILVLQLYRRLAFTFHNSKKSLLARMDFKADAKQLADFLLEKVPRSVSLKKLDIEAARNVIQVIRELPIGWCSQGQKMKIFTFHLAALLDLKAAEQDDLTTDMVNILMDILHFGEQIQVYKYFPIGWLMEILPPNSMNEFYQHLFSTLWYDADEAERFLESVTEILKQHQHDLTDDHLTLLLLSIKFLTQGAVDKKLKKFLDNILQVYAAHVMAFFKSTDDRNSKADRGFVEKTIPGFVTYLNWVLLKPTEANVVNEDLRRTCKIYIGHSMDYHNPHAIKLFMAALKNKTILHFDQDEIEFVLSNYWKQLNEDLRQDKLDQNTSVSVIRIIVDNRTNEDFLKMLEKIDNDSTLEEKQSEYICRVVSLLAKCHFSNIKGAIFDEQFRFIITHLLTRPSNIDFIDHKTAIALLECQKAAVENTQIPLSYYSLDDVLTLLMDLHLEKYIVADSNMSVFFNLHQAMTELCAALMKYRHVFLADRVAQFAHVFDQLLLSLCWYKSDRKKDTLLSDDELNNLAELALKLESVMHLIAAHSVEFKRIAPYILTFALGIMVSGKRTTTLYPKIKKHFDNICYTLLGICDHRSGTFILRCSSEAVRQAYENLVTSHRKYYRFTGRV